MTSMSRDYIARLGKDRRKRVRSGPLSPDQRAQAVKRIQDEYNARSFIEREKGLTDARRRREAAGEPEPVKQPSPQGQRRSAERIRERANHERRVNTDDGAVAAPERGGKRFSTIRGPHRMSFRQAYSRRTTDTSRARVMELYDRTKPPSQPKARVPAGPQMRSRGQDDIANVVAQIRSKTGARKRRGGGNRTYF